MRVSPDGQNFDSGIGDDQSAKVWDAADGREVLTLEGHHVRYPRWPFRQTTDCS
jgi:hypothetical protein